jgi:hypothetical protein
VLDKQSGPYGLGYAWGRELAPKAEAELTLCTPDTVTRALEQLLLHLEVLARDEVETVEPSRQEHAHVFLDVRSRRAAQRVADTLIEVVEQASVDHLREVSPPGTSLERPSPNTPQLGARPGRAAAQPID